MLFQEYFQRTRLIPEDQILVFIANTYLQLLSYKTWTTTQSNVWGNQEPTDKIFVIFWQEFLKTLYGQTNVPDWFGKLQSVIQSLQELQGESSEGKEIPKRNG